MINIFANNTESDFYWRLKNLRLRATRNPENETAFYSLAQKSIAIEHEHEILFFKYASCYL